MSEPETPAVTIRGLLRIFAVGIIIDTFLLSVIVLIWYRWIAALTLLISSDQPPNTIITCDSGLSANQRFWVVLGVMTFGVVLACMVINCVNNFLLGDGRREIDDEQWESGGSGNRDAVTGGRTVSEDVVVDEGKEWLMEES